MKDPPRAGDHGREGTVVFSPTFSNFMYSEIFHFDFWKHKYRLDILET